MRTAIAAAATVGMLVGAAMVSTSVVSSAVSPATLAFLRYLVGAAVLLLPLDSAVRTTFSVKDAIAIATLGVFQFAVLVLLLNHALLTVSATVCALVFATMPLVTLPARDGFRDGVPAGFLRPHLAAAASLAESASVGQRRVHWPIERGGLFLLVVGAGQAGCEQGQGLSSLGSGDRRAHRVAAVAASCADDGTRCARDGLRGTRRVRLIAAHRLQPARSSR